MLTSIPIKTTTGSVDVPFTILGERLTKELKNKVFSRIKIEFFENPAPVDPETVISLNILIFSTAQKNQIRYDFKSTLYYKKGGKYHYVSRDGYIIHRNSK